VRSELRVVVWLGLAVAAWLFLVPTASADGSDCGTPIFRTDDLSASQAGFDEGCGERNATRATQGWMTLLGAGALAGGDRLWRAMRPPASPSKVVGALRRDHTSSDPPRL